MRCYNNFKLEEIDVCQLLMVDRCKVYVFCEFFNDSIIIGAIISVSEDRSNILLSLMIVYEDFPFVYVNLKFIYTHYNFSIDIIEFCSVYFINKNSLLVKIIKGYYDNYFHFHLYHLQAEYQLAHSFMSLPLSECLSFSFFFSFHLSV